MFSLLWTPAPSLWPEGDSTIFTNLYWCLKPLFIAARGKYCSTSLHYLPPGTRGVKNLNQSDAFIVDISHLYLPHTQIRGGNGGPPDLSGISQPPYCPQKGCIPSAADSSGRGKRNAGYRPNLEQFQDHAAHSVDDHERCISQTIMDDNYSWAQSWFCWKHLSVNVA